MYNRITYLAE